eukprot:3585804-Amphidinium_carterae.1
MASPILLSQFLRAAGAFIECAGDIALLGLVFHIHSFIDACGIMTIMIQSGLKALCRRVASRSILGS